MEKTEVIKVYNKKLFYYRVILRYYPHIGVSMAVYNDETIGHVELNKIHEPSSDHDWEWENYEERLVGWMEEARDNLLRKCEEYFNKKLQT